MGVLAAIVIALAAAQACAALLVSLGALLARSIR
jgi:hypothetical protein